MDNNLDLKKFLWKKRLLLIRDNLIELNLIKEEQKKNKQQLDKNKIEYFFILNQNLTSNITLIGLDGLVKHKSNKLDLKKIFNLISKMPMANF